MLLNDNVADEILAENLLGLLPRVLQRLQIIEVRILAENEICNLVKFLAPTPQHFIKLKF